VFRLCRGRFARRRCGSACTGAGSQHHVLPHLCGHRQWRQSWWPRRRRQLLPDAGAGCRRRRQDLARLSLDPGRRWRACRERARPHRQGAWQNSKGVAIAKDVAELHGANNLNKQTALTEKGEVVNGYGDQPNRHDILTGSQPDGTAFGGPDDRTCKNWTSSTQGAAMVGHSDLSGPATNPTVKSWNAAHPSRGPDGGCSQADLKSTGGDGLLYCFAAN